MYRPTLVLVFIHTCIHITYVTIHKYVTLLLWSLKFIPNIEANVKTNPKKTFHFK